uniref:RING-CH-type domain-containing protein n=1 Tax=Panagrolaimus davidi TaxID=227884 RepID=A0A914QCY1_9BILA
MACESTSLVFTDHLIEEYTCVSSSFSTAELLTAKEMLSEEELVKAEEIPISLNVNNEGLAAEEKHCRICLESKSTEGYDQWIIPCKCDESMKWVHQKCFEQWIAISLTRDADTRRTKSGDLISCGKASKGSRRSAGSGSQQKKKISSCDEKYQPRSRSKEREGNSVKTEVDIIIRHLTDGTCWFCHPQHHYIVPSERLASREIFKAQCAWGPASGLNERRTDCGGYIKIRIVQVNDELYVRVVGKAKGHHCRLADHEKDEGLLH